MKQRSIKFGVLLHPSVDGFGGGITTTDILHTCILHKKCLLNLLCLFWIKIPSRSMKAVLGQELSAISGNLRKQRIPTLQPNPARIQKRVHTGAID